MRVVDSWSDAPSQVSKADVEKVLRSVKTTQDYFMRRNSNIMKFAVKYENEDYLKVVNMYDESITQHADRIAEQLSVLLGE